MLLRKIEGRGFASFRDHFSVEIPTGITGIIGSIEDDLGNVIENKSNGCVTGDSIININRCTLGRKYRIDHAYRAFKQIKKHSYIKTWDVSKPTYIRSFTGDRVHLHEIEDILYSGKKEVWELILENGLSLKATADHKIMTRRGWVELTSLKVAESEVMCDTLKARKSLESVTKKDKDTDKEIWSLRYHPYAKKVSKGVKKEKEHTFTYYRLPIHRLIYEAYINDLTYEEYLYIIRKEEDKSKLLKFIDPAVYVIHHKDFNHYNNDIANLECVGKIAHYKIHAEKGKYNFNQGVPHFSKVCSIAYCGLEDTYDIKCKEPYHNFVANGIVVHNSGKSSLFMAMLYALYGIGEYNKQEEIWNDKLAPTDEAFVKVFFNLMGNEYTVERGRKGKGAYLDFKEGTKRLGDGNDEAQAYIISLLGRDSELFTASAFVAQKKLAAFIETDPAVRKGYIDSITDLAYWRDAAKTSKRNRETAEEAQAKLVEAIAELEKGITANNIKIEQLTKEVEELAGIEIERRNAQAELDKIKNIETTLNTLREYTTLYQQLTREITATEERCNRISLEELAADTAFTNVSQRFEASRSFDSDRESAELLQIYETQKTATENLNTHINEERVIYKDIVNTEAALKTERASLLNLTEAVCSRCKQAVTKEFVELYNAKAYKKIEELQSHLDYTAQSKVDLDAGINSFKLAISNLSLQAQKQSAAIAEYTRIEKEYASALDVFQKTKTRLQTERDQSSDTLVTKRADLSIYAAKTLELQAQLPATEFADRTAMEKNIAEFDRKIGNIHVKKGFLQKLQEDQDKFRKNTEDFRIRIIELTDKIYAYEVLGDAFKDIPTVLLKESIVEIEEYANEFIQTVLPEYKVKLYEDLTKQNRPLLIAFEVFDKTRNYKLLSGGQQSICAIGLRIGFNKVITRKAKVSLNFLVLDEIFSALDGFNRNEVLKTLISLNQIFPQILVITHTEEASLFPRTIHVRMNSVGESRILS